MSENAIATTNGKTSIAMSQHGMAIRTMDELWKFATCVQRSGIAPKSYKTVEQIVVGIQCGMELGFSPMASLKAVAVINGTPCVWGDGLKALVERSPECEYVKEWIEGEGEKMVAYCEAKRRGRLEPTRQKFSHSDAKAASLLGKDTYKAYLRRMLQMRARSWALRDQFPDLLQGLSVAEEVQDHADAIEGQLVNGDPAPQQGVQALLESMDADDDQQEPLEQPEAAPPWVTIEFGDEQVAKAIYDEFCGPDSEATMGTQELCELAWQRRNGISPKEVADSLFTK
jgi:hypothetical protein